MKISYTKIFVKNQAEALDFYTEIVGFVKKADVVQGQYRWLTVVSPDDQSGTELVLEKNSDPAAKAFQKAIFEQGNVAANFNVEDVQTEYQRLKMLGVNFTMEPTEVMPGVTIAIFDDTCGNLIQIQKTPDK
ncbi:MAG TPA: VOC family protein [Candidatus Saccharimonadales bacterium]